MFLFLNSAYLTKFFNQTRNFTENPRKEVDMFILFLGGLCLLTGVYGLYCSGVHSVLLLSVIWGAILIGYWVGKEL